MIDDETEWSFYTGYALLILVVLGAAYTLVRRLERSWIDASRCRPARQNGSLPRSV